MYHQLRRAVERDHRIPEIDELYINDRKLSADEQPFPVTSRRAVLSIHRTATPSQCLQVTIHMLLAADSDAPLSEPTSCVIPQTAPP